MSDLITMINHLLTTWLAGQAQGSAWQTREAKVDDHGLTIIGQITHAQWQGEVIIRVDVELTQGIRQTLSLTVQRWPQQMPSILESFRDVLTSAKLTLELDVPSQETA